MATNETMTVKVRDRSRESNYAYGPFFKTVTISKTCPTCGGRRGEPIRRALCVDGEWFAVDQWTNPCGHVDAYADVIKEAAVLTESEGK